MIHDRLVALAMMFGAFGTWLLFASDASMGDRVWGAVVALPALTYLGFGLRAQVRAIKEDNRQARLRREERRRGRDKR